MKSQFNYQLALPPHFPITGGSVSEKPYYTGKELYDMGVKDIPWLVDNIFLKSGIMVLSGSSDVGKSTLLRQLSLTIVSGQDNFLGWRLNATYKKVIYVSTEDDKTAVSYSLNKSLDETAEKSYLTNVRYIFNTKDLVKNLNKMLEESPADCIIIDALGDIYGGQLNQMNEVRNFFNDYFSIVDKHNCLVIFLHHTGKRTEALPPSKNNLIGSQGIEGKARQVIEIRKDPHNSQHRHLCIVKGNYLPEGMKTHSYKLKFNDNLTFDNTGDRVEFDQLVISPDDKKQDREELAERIIELVEDEGLTYEEVAVKMTEEGHKMGKSKAFNIYKEYTKSKVIVLGPPPETAPE
jgi:archaellum biogenesis ATPase FlaH